MGLMQYFWRGLGKREENHAILSQCVKPREMKNVRGSPTVENAPKERERRGPPHAGADQSGAQ